jgi:hypothetical protein
VVVVGMRGAAIGARRGHKDGNAPDGEEVVDSD